VVLSVLVVLVELSVLLELSEVVEDGAAAVEEAAADAELESEVVVASALVVVFAFVKVVLALFVFVLSSLFLKSSRSAPVSEWHSCANKTACFAAPASEHPPPTKHCSISSNDSRSRFLSRHAVIDFEHPQVVLETSSLISFRAHFIPEAETIAAPVHSARRKDRIVAIETSGADKLQHRETLVKILSSPQVGLMM
jgi:hypothetical protein